MKPPATSRAPRRSFRKPAGNPRTRIMALGLLVALLVLWADQASKFWVLHGLDLPDKHRVVVLPVLNFTLVWNQGVTFGLLRAGGAWGPVLLAGGALVVVAVLLAWLRRTTRISVAIALGAIAGGAIGNVADRLRHGAVVDFIEAHAFGYSWYVFNLADAAIVCGVALMLLDSLWRGSE